MKRFLLFMTLGGAAGYFLDPKRGSQRRSSIAGKVPDSVKSTAQTAASSAGSIANKVPSGVKNTAQTAAFAGSKAGSAVSQAGNSARQTVGRKAGGSGQPDNPNPDDNTLRDRVESELFREPGVEKGRLNVMVVDGVVDLRGELDTQQQIDSLVAQARAIEHVRDVRSYLHLPNTDAPNKESAIEASDTAP